MRTTGLNNNCIMRIPEEKRTENIFKAIMAVQTWGEIWTSRAMGPKGRQIDYFKMAIETHCNYTVKSQTRKNFKRSRGATLIYKGPLPIDYGQISQQKLCSPGQNGVIYSKY